METYILALAGVIILSAVVACIAPSGKMGKFIGGMTKLLPLVVMIAPLIGLVKGDGLALSEAAGSVESDAGYFAACAARLESADEAEISAYLGEKFSVSAQVESVRGAEPPFRREKIKILVAPDGINGEDERIHILTRIREAVEADFGCDAEVS